MFSRGRHGAPIFIMSKRKVVWIPMPISVVAMEKYRLKSCSCKCNLTGLPSLPSLPSLACPSLAKPGWAELPQISWDDRLQSVFANFYWQMTAVVDYAGGQGNNYVHLIECFLSDNKSIISCIHGNPMTNFPKISDSVNLTLPLHLEFLSNLNFQGMIFRCHVDATRWQIALNFESVIND